jgi:hypothetical protein
VEAAEQQQQRPGRRKLTAAPAVLDDIEKAGKENSADEGEHEGRHTFSSLRSLLMKNKRFDFAK